MSDLNATRSVGRAVARAQKQLTLKMKSKDKQYVGNQNSVRETITKQ